jgi:hypothetical protein
VLKIDNSTACNIKIKVEMDINRSPFEVIKLYYNTVRYLRGSQVFGRFLIRFFHPKPDLRPSPVRRRISGDWKAPIDKQISMLSQSKFRFLNAEHELLFPKDWNSEHLPKLWLYNLHYFDDLNSFKASVRQRWHQKLISRWISQNPPGKGCGWEPYPLSIRIVNWIKHALSGNVPNKLMIQSLAVQIRFLRKRLEWHLLGNHLLVNGKALIFGGCYFGGVEAQSWLTLGMEILGKQLPEQILLDGGHFERSTMYHVLVIEDILDLINLAQTYPDAFIPWKGIVESWSETVTKMANWMMAMCHPDGEISFFNDAAIGIAPPPSAVCQYSNRLGVNLKSNNGAVKCLAGSGYIRVESGPAVLIIDAAEVGPSYLPGHAHADTLSFELSLYGRRFLVNSGTSCYGLGAQREMERSTAAHNTVVIEGRNSSEVWAGFRVASRAHPFSLMVHQVGDKVIVEASHDGYCRLPGKPIHRRRWTIDPNQLVVCDRVEGKWLNATSHVYLHPEVIVEEVGLLGQMRHTGRKVLWESNWSRLIVEPTEWYPQFGVSVPNKRIKMAMISSEKGIEGSFTLKWS